MSLKNLLRPTLLLLAAMIWGFAFVAQDAASAVPSFALGFIRSIFAFVFLLMVIPVSDFLTKNRRKLISKNGIDFKCEELVGGAITGVVLAVASALQQIGISLGTDGGKAGFITALYVVLVPIYSIILKKKTRLHIWISIIIATIGFFLLCITEQLTIAPSDLAVMGGAMIFPIHILAIDYYSPKCDGIRMSAIQFLTCALINLILSLVFETPLDTSGIYPHLGSLIYLGIMSSGVAYTLQIIGQKNVNPTVASIILSLESVFAVIGTALILGQTLTPREYFGCALVLFAVILSQLDFGKNEKSEDSSYNESPASNK